MVAIDQSERDIGFSRPDLIQPPEAVSPQRRQPAAPADEPAPPARDSQVGPGVLAPDPVAAPPDTDKSSLASESDPAAATGELAAVSSRGAATRSESPPASAGAAVGTGDEGQTTAERQAPEGDNSADVRNSTDESSVELVLVGQRPTAQRADAYYVATIEEAVEQLSLHPEIASIEVALNGPLPCQPLRFALTHPVTLRAAAGYSPLLVFTPELPAWSGRRRMASIEGAMLTVEGIHWAMLPPDDWTNDWSLFGLRQGGGLTLQSCTATIVATTSVAEQSATFFELVDDRRAPMGMMGMLHPATEPSPPAEVSCVRSILRGPATVLRCPRADRSN